MLAPHVRLWSCLLTAFSLFADGAAVAPARRGALIHRGRPAGPLRAGAARELGPRRLDGGLGGRDRRGGERAALRERVARGAAEE